MNTILTSGSKTEDVSNTLISFKDCPNQCYNGMYVDPFRHKRIKCEYCAKKRENFVKEDAVDNDTGKSISELLELPVCFTGKEYREDTVLPEFARTEIEGESLTLVFNRLTQLMNEIKVGLLPSCSLMFNLGKKSNDTNFIYPFLIQTYMVGKTLTPLVTPATLCQLRMAYEGYSGVVKTERTYTYLDLLDRDVCVVSIDAGATYTGIQAVKGLMQLRAHKLKPTIIFTNLWNSYIRDMCTEGGYTAYGLAQLYSVEYKNKSEGTSDNKNNSHQSLNNYLDSKAGERGALTSNEATPEFFKSLLKPTYGV